VTRLDICESTADNIQEHNKKIETHLKEKKALLSHNCRGLEKEHVDVCERSALIKEDATPLVRVTPYDPVPDPGEAVSMIRSWGVKPLLLSPFKE
jgi:hypothetical protein